MRIAIILTSIYLIGCSKSPDVQLKSTRDFNFPIGDLKTKKTFVFKKVNGTETTYVNHKIVDFENKKYLTSVAGYSHIKFDSAILLMEEPIRMFEIYRYEYDTFEIYSGITKGTIEDENYFDNGTPYGGRERTIKYELGYIQSKYNTVENFIKDTTYVWNGKTIPALYFERVLKLRVGVSFIPFLGKSGKSKGYSIYGKDLGVVKYGREIDNELMEWELIEIK